MRKFTKPTVKFQDPNIFSADAAVEAVAAVAAVAAVEAFVFNRFTPALLVFIGNCFEYETSVQQSF